MYKSSTGGSTKSKPTRAKTPKKGSKIPKTPKKVPKIHKKQKKYWFDEDALSGCDEPPGEDEMNEIGLSFLDGKTPVKKPNAIITIGYAGAGKTTGALNLLGKKHNYVVVSADDIVVKMKGFLSGTNINSDPKGAILGSKDIFIRCINSSEEIWWRLLATCIEDGYNILCDLPTTVEQSWKKIKASKKFTITGLFVARSWNNIKKAIESRAMETGRWLPKNTEEHFIRYKKMEMGKIAGYIKKYADTFIFCVNDPKVRIRDSVKQYLKNVDVPQKTMGKSKLANNSKMIYYLVDIDAIPDATLVNLLMSDS